MRDVSRKLLLETRCSLLAFGVTSMACLETRVWRVQYTAVALKQPQHHFVACRLVIHLRDAFYSGCFLNRALCNVRCFVQSKTANYLFAVHAHKLNLLRFLWKFLGRQIGLQNVVHPFIRNEERAKGPFALLLCTPCRS